MTAVRPTTESVTVVLANNGRSARTATVHLPGQPGFRGTAEARTTGVVTAGFEVTGGVSEIPGP